jgi:2'-5' RNA ligase
MPFMTNLNYSLWLMPEGELQNSLAALIQKIAREHAAPAFPAHITLLGNVNGKEPEMVARTHELATASKTFPITLTGVDTTPEYYRALFIGVELSTELSHLYAQARQIFRFEPQRAYRPHLSLLYSDLSREQKQQIIGTLQPRLQALLHTFTARTLHLYSTEGPTESWQQIGSFPLA